ncbi:hypothetical protein JZ751_011309, partial [Albula glossodonta]
MIPPEVRFRDTPGPACENGIQMDLFLHCSLVPAFAIVAILSFLQRRSGRTPLDERLAILRGRFGVVVPLDVMGSLRNRWSYGFAFGAVSSSVLLLFSQDHLLFYMPPWASVLVFLVAALEVGMAYYPFFACLSTPLRGVGSILGILYTLTWIIVTLWDIVSCPGGSWPSVLCMLFLLGRFVHMLVKHIRIHLGLEAEE